MRNEIQETLLDDQLFLECDKFALLKKVNSDKKNFRNNAILTAMRLENGQWGDCAEIASSLVRKAGLFLYLHDEATPKDTLAREYYRSPSGRDAYMHRAQFEVLSKLLSGKSIILSAPTSFGKSYVIDELLLSNRYDNVLIIVPTIALIDETRRRIGKLPLEHKIVCFTSQTPGEKNIYILTQERALEMQNKIQSLDLLVIDEFYKMDSSLQTDDSDRAGLLNVCYKIYENKSKQTYLLGPYIKNVEGYMRSRNTPEIIVTEDNTTFIQLIHLKGNKEEAVKKIIKEEQNNILIYCNSTGGIASLYKEIETVLYDYDGTKLNLDFANWIDENVCPDWYVTEALKLGIGVHHAQMPRFVAQEMVRRFNSGDIKILLCTSTIIEGVNTAAKTVIVYSLKRGTRKMDGFTFKNIAGRAGRMLRHFSGKVYYFALPQETDDIVVTDHIGDDKDGIEANMLSLLGEEQLTTKQADKVHEHTTNIQIPFEVIKQNYFIAPQILQKVYENIQANKYPLLASIRSNHPNISEMHSILQALGDLGLNFAKIGQAKNQLNGIKRVSIFISAFLKGGVEGLARAHNINKELSDKDIEFAFDFVRNQLSYKLPRYIKALDSLLNIDLYRDGTLEPFASTLEFLNKPPTYIQLDELGIPVQISDKLSLSTESIEHATKQLKQMKSSRRLTNFENQVVSYFNEV